MQALEWTGRSLRYLDQRQLPHSECVLETDDPRQVVEAIQSLAIRGAPLIGIAASYAAVLAVLKLEPRGSRAQCAALLESFLEVLAAARPTAVNLRFAVERMRERARSGVWSTVPELAAVLEREALALHEEDRRACDAIGRSGAALLTEGSAVLTHCNTGALATGGDGTALNVIRHGWQQGLVRHVFVGETRPLFQGSRLTAWELGKLSIPYTIVADSAAAFLMAQGRVDAVIVGADRIAANGDVANKIGTYSLAVSAGRSGIPFYVAAPVSTIDRRARSGADIPIEERSAQEITRIGSTSVAPPDAAAYSPAFDVTPAELIWAIITDRGVLTPPLAKAIAAVGD